MAKRHIEKLTVKKIAKLTEPGRYGDGKGLYLQVVNASSRSWILRYEIADPNTKTGRRERCLGLGSEADFNIKEARDRARKARQLLKDGIDPIDKKKTDKSAAALAKAKTLTFKEAAQAFFNQHEKEWRSAKHRAQFLSSMEQYVYPKIGSLLVPDIDTGQVLRVLEQKHPDYPDQQIWEVIRVTADRVRSRIEQVLDWCTARGYRTGNNPAKWKGHIAEIMPKRSKAIEHLAALPYADIPTFMTELREREGTAAAALEFCILTSARTAEIIGAQLDEIDLTEKIWSVPPGRIKGNRLHRVPLSDRALEILQDKKACPRESGNPFLFIGLQQGGGLDDEAMLQLLKRMGRDDITVHGFRSTFRDWAGETTSFPSDICEVAIAHKVKGKTQAAYQRGDLLQKRRKLMEAWTDYCESPQRSGDIVPIRGHKV
jgi:integrase